VHPHWHGVRGAPLRNRLSIDRDRRGRAAQTEARGSPLPYECRRVRSIARLRAEGTARRSAIARTHFGTIYMSTCMSLRARSPKTTTRSPSTWVGAELLVQVDWLTQLARSSPNLFSLTSRRTSARSRRVNGMLSNELDENRGQRAARLRKPTIKYRPWCRCKVKVTAIKRVVSRGATGVATETAANLCLMSSFAEGLLFLLHEAPRSMLEQKEHLLARVEGCTTASWVTQSGSSSLTC
jgi:hypothetical protein